MMGIRILQGYLRNGLSCEGVATILQQAGIEGMGKARPLVTARTWMPC
jgi:hypothetical protein